MAVSEWSSLGSTWVYTGVCPKCSHSFVYELPQGAAVRTFAGPSALFANKTGQTVSVACRCADASHNPAVRGGCGHVFEVTV